MSKIAILGLGAMGSRIAARLAQAGHDVTAWNRSPAPADAARVRGIRIADTPRAAATGADIVLAMLSDDDASRAVWTPPETGALAGLARDAVAIEISTLSPDWTRELAAAVAARGASFLDAPVAGSLPQAEAGQLVVFAGGDAATFAQAKPLFDTYAVAAHHVGPAGHGIAMKLAVNTLLALQVAGLAETLAGAEKAGLDLRATMEVLASLPIASPAGTGMGRLMVAGDHAPRFTTRLMAKDLRYAATAAHALGASTPLLDTAREAFDRACDAGSADENMTAIVKRYRA